jgi:3-deoxy-D-manno-octulosonic-acid transferase
MGKILYNLGVVGYGMVIHLISPFNQKAKNWVSGRKNWRINLVESVKILDFNKPIVWFHASSLGEFEQGRPVMEALKKEIDFNLVVTFFSPSGYDIMKKWPAADLVCYLPLDTDKNARDFIKLIKPNVAVFIKYEIWYHYLKQLKKQAITTFLISARFYHGQIFFKPWAKWYRKVIFLFDKIYVQDKESKNLLNGIGFDSVELTGDTRYDRVGELSNNEDSFPEIEQFKNGNNLFIAGSSWPIDEAIICQYINRFPGKYKYLIAPHDISESHLKKIEKQLKVPVQRYSGYQNKKPATVLILDTIGMLSRVYKYAKVAYIGGAFKEGLHNILEPAAYGIPVITGPDHKGFPEGLAMEKSGGLVRITDFENFESLMNQWADDEESRQKVAFTAKKFIHEQIGATQKITKDIERVLSELKISETF